MQGAYLCSYAALPYVPVPGGNLFIADQDLTTPPDAEGNRAIHCTSITDLHGMSLAAKGVRLMVRLAGGLE